MTRAEQQAERFRRTPCLADDSRRKMKSVMWQNKTLTGDKVAKLLDRKSGSQRRLEKAEKSTLDRDNFIVFTDMIADLGGVYEPYRDRDERKIHTGSAAVVRSVPFAKEITKSRVDMELQLIQTNFEVAAQAKDMDGMAKAVSARKKFQGVYYRDLHGSLRRVLAK
jgi:hypothetical protein